MKRLPILAAAVGLMIGAPAFAQPDNRPQDQRPAAQAHQAQAQAKAHRQAAAQRADRKPAQAAKARAANQAQRHANVNRTRNVTQNVHRNVTQTVHRNVTQNVHRNVTTNVQRNVTVHRTVDVARYRRAFQAPHRYHVAQAWAPPRGYSYRRFSLGERVPTAFLVADLFLSNFGTYGLVSPPSGYVWVRDGNDAVLVDRYTGEVIQVQYDVFY